METLKVDKTIVINSLFLIRQNSLLLLLIINLLLGIFVIRVIHTQSKSIGSFKYYLINQVIWAQLFEIVFITLSPVILCPYFSGFMSGFFRTIATPQVARICFIVAFCLFFNLSLSVFITLINRFVFTFHPRLKSYFQCKYTFACIIFLHLLMYLLVVCVMIPSMTETENLRKGMYPDAEKALKPYLTEISLIYINGVDGLIQKVCMIFLVYYILLTIILFGTLSKFIISVTVLKRKLTVVSKTGMSLIVSSLVLGCLCFVFLFIPVGSLTFVWAFKIENSANVVNALLVLVSLHCTLDMISILYFIKSYRQYCKHLVYSFLFLT